VTTVVFSGDIVGTGIDNGQFLTYPNGSALYADYGTITGTISGQGSGSFTISEFDGVVTRNNMEFEVPASGSGDFVGITGRPYQRLHVRPQHGLSIWEYLAEPETVAKLASLRQWAERYTMIAKTYRLQQHRQPALPAPPVLSMPDSPPYRWTKKSGGRQIGGPTEPEIGSVDGDGLQENRQGSGLIPEVVADDMAAGACRVASRFWSA
jgi:Protein of unknown function (DUF3224)